VKVRDDWGTWTFEWGSANNPTTVLHGTGTGQECPGGNKLDL